MKEQLLEALSLLDEGGWDPSRFWSSGDYAEAPAAHHLLVRFIEVMDAHGHIEAHLDELQGQEP